MTTPSATQPQREDGAPERIFLVASTERHRFGSGATWCQTRVNRDDVEYVRADLSPAPRWIACAERLPEFYGEYVVWRPGMKHGREAYFASKSWEMIDDDRRLGEFTHWQPLPVAPDATPTGETR